jgi:hypothetical protein
VTEDSAFNVGLKIRDFWDCLESVRLKITNPHSIRSENDVQLNTFSIRYLTIIYEIHLLRSVASDTMIAMNEECGSGSEIF